MDRPVNPGVTSAFIAEAMSYLPQILEALEVAGQGPANPAGLEDAYRLVHTIRGASSLVGFASISDRAAAVETALEQIVVKGGELGGDDARHLQEMVCEIGAEIDRLATDAGAGGFDDDSWMDANLSDDGDGQPGASASASGGGGDDDAAADVDMSFDDEVPPELMDVFVVEAQDHLQTIARTLSVLKTTPDDRGTLQELRRSVHTLKGAAGMVGYRTVSQLAHRAEDLLDALYDGEIQGTPETTSLLFSSADMLHQLVSGEGDLNAHKATIQSLYARFAVILKPLAASGGGGGGQAGAHGAGSSSSGDTGVFGPLDGETGEWSSPDSGMFRAPESGAIAKPGKAAPTSTTARQPGETAAAAARRNKARQHVRVQIDKLDDLINLVGELVINRSTVQQYLANITRELQELGQSVTRLRMLWSKLETEYEIGTPMGRMGGGRFMGGHTEPQHPRHGEAAHGFDELEFDHYTETHMMSRQLSETVGDIDAVQRQLTDTVAAFDGDFSRMKRLTTDAQDRLLRLRMVPLGSQATRFDRVVRVTAESLGKQVEFAMDGEAVALDRPILDELGDAMLHILRNAVDHGIEAPDVREAVGKPPKAKITVKAFYEGAHAIIQVIDDGRGLNLSALRDVALREGHVTPDQLHEMSDRDLHMLIFRPQFSTARQVSEVSGRGVGLDVVKEKIQQLNGTVTVDSVPGRGVTFTLRLPLTLAVARVLIVKAGKHTLAVPATSIARVLRVDREEVEVEGEIHEVKLEGESYAAVHLLKALGHEPRPEDKTSRVSALILASTENRTALVVDHLVEARDVVVTMLTGHLKRVRGLAGATVLGDGQVVVILNPDELLAHAGALRAAQGGVRPALPERETALRILVVDDSLSVRQVLSGLVKRAGWTAMLARDGLEALEMLQREATPPDLIFSDVEMPRMDGYELTSTVKADPKLKRTPVVFITSRAGEKHRRRGFEVGAAGYLVKPFDEQALLSLVYRLLGVRPDTSGIDRMSDSPRA
jgi:chemosensory pili system protein ChpA (sensor histidine kinase/response regulator)